MSTRKPIILKACTETVGSILHLLIRGSWLWIGDLWIGDLWIGDLWIGDLWIFWVPDMEISIDLFLAISTNSCIESLMMW